MADIVWQHGRKVKGGFKCNYCGREKSGGGATRFKQHLAHRGCDVADCPSVPPDVKAYFIEQLERNKDKARERARQKLLRDAAARSSNVDAEQLGARGTMRTKSCRKHYDIQGRSTSSCSKLAQDMRGVVALDHELEVVMFGACSLGAGHMSLRGLGTTTLG